MPLSTQSFFGCLILIIFLNASAVAVAYFDFNFCTRRYRDIQSTATRRYLKSLLFFASLSTYLNQLTIFRLCHRLLLLTQVFFRRTDRYFVYACSECNKCLTFRRGSLVSSFKFFTFPNRAAPLDVYFFKIFSLQLV